MTVVTSDNRYGVAQLIVAPTLAEGANYTTIAAALTAAVSGQTIFIRPGTYTEAITLKAGVNLVAYEADAFTPNVIINGTCTHNTAGTVTISGIQLRTNSNFCVAVTGSEASVLYLTNCYINCLNNTGISYTSSSASSRIRIVRCTHQMGTTGITLFVATGAGRIDIAYLNDFEGTAGTLTPSSTSACIVAMRFCQISFPLSTSSTGAFDLYYTRISPDTQGATALTTAGTATSGGSHCEFASGTAVAVSIGAGTTVSLLDCIISSSNTNSIDGAGTLNYTNLTFSSASTSTMTTTTQSAGYSRPGITRSAHQPAFLAYLNTSVVDVTGDGTIYTVIFDTEPYDQGANFNLGTSTFTAPVTGRYRFEFGALVGGGTVLSACSVRITTTALTYQRSIGTNAGVTTSTSGTIVALASMTAGDTATFQVATTDTGGKIDDVNGTTGGVLRTWVSGNLVC